MLLKRLWMIAQLSADRLSLNVPVLLLAAIVPGNPLVLGADSVASPYQ
jgi:hypothetical protein